MSPARAREAAVDSPSGTLRRTVRRCVLIGLLCLLLVTAVVYVVSDALAEREALRDATLRARGIAHGVAAPLMTAEVRGGDLASLERMDEVLGARIAEGGVSHIVLWESDGRVLWASRGDSAGRVFPLPRDAREALGGQKTVAHLPEAASEHPAGLSTEEGQLEVYVGSVGADGNPFLFEAYLPADRIEDDRAAVLPKLLGVGLGSALLLFALTVPLALRLARRVDAEQQARLQTMQRSVLAWRQQRRQLAQDLHDGVIQDMAAISMGLTLLDGRGLHDASSATVLGRIQESARRGEASLRSLVLDLSPRDLGSRGLEDAVVDLAREHSSHELDITVACTRGLDLSEETGILAFRTVREGLRNVVKHAGATSVLVDVRPGEVADTLEVVIEDDGRVPPAEAVGSGQGLLLLAETLADAGGTLELGPGPNGGARLRAVIPCGPRGPAGLWSPPILGGGRPPGWRFRRAARGARLDVG